MATVTKRSWVTTKGQTKTAWKVDFVDQAGNRQRRQFASKKAADRFRIAVEGQVNKGVFRPGASKVAFREVCETFLEHCERRMQRNERMTRKMLAVYRGHVNNHLLHPEHGIGQHKLSQVTAGTVGQLRDRMREVGVTVPTARKALATLHAILEFANSQDLVAANAAHGVRVIGPRDEGSKKVTPPSKEDLRTLLKGADEDLRLRLLFAATTGVRAGEQWALRWRNIDFDAGELHVGQRIDAYGEEGPPKSAAGVRTVPLSGHLLTDLKAWRLRSGFAMADDLIFPNRDGKHTCHDNLIKRRFKALFAEMEKAHTEDPRNARKPSRCFNWHGLRHFAVSTWIEAGLSPKAVQTFAGHSSLQVTMDRYGHLFPSEEHGTAMDGVAVQLFV